MTFKDFYASLTPEGKAKLIKTLKELGGMGLIHNAESPFYTYQEAAEYLRRSVRTLYNNKTIPRVDGLFLKEDLDNYVRR